jgi:hypothetical protein
MKLRQSIAAFKRPKLDENFTLKPNNNITLNPKSSNAPGAKEQATALSTSMESMEDSIENTSTAEKTLGKRVETKTMKPSVGIVEMQNDEMGLLGSLCFRKSLPENFYDENMYTPCNMVGGKLRKVYRGTGSGLLSARRQSKELLVRCESIMIYPKVLVNQKEQTDKFATNSKQQSAKYKVTGNHQQQSDKVVVNLQKHSNEFARKPDKPKEAWNDNTTQPSLNSKGSDTNYTRLPQLNAKDQSTPKGHNQNASPETPLDDPTPVVEVHTIQNCTEQPSIESQIAKNSASTKIIIPFGENELIKQSGVRSRSKSENVGGERGTPMKSRCLVNETSTLQKIQEVVTLKTELQKEEGVEGSVKTAGGSDVGERGKPMKLRFLKESSKLNEQSHSTQRHSDITVGVGRAEIARKLPVATQYLTVNTTNTLKRFRIPTGIENSELFIGRENYPPKTKTGPYRFAYSQKGLSEYGKNFDGVKQHIGRQSVPLKIGGKGLLKARLARNEEVSGKLAEDESKKRVQFLVHNSRYFT